MLNRVVWLAWKVICALLLALIVVAITSLILWTPSDLKAVYNVPAVAHVTLPDPFVGRSPEVRIQTPQVFFRSMGGETYVRSPGDLNATGSAYAGFKEYGNNDVRLWTADSGVTYTTLHVQEPKSGLFQYVSWYPKDVTANSDRSLQVTLAKGWFGTYFVFLAERFFTILGGIWAVIRLLGSLVKRKLKEVSG